MAYFHKDQFPRVDLGSGEYSRRLIAFGGGLLFAEMEFEAGAVSVEHIHDEEQLTYCASGEFESMVDGVAGRLGPGDSFYAGKNVPHGVRCLEDGKLLHAFTPQREDYKKG